MQIHRIAVVSLLPPPQAIDETVCLSIFDVVVRISQVYGTGAIGKPPDPANRNPLFSWWRQSDLKPAHAVVIASGSISLNDPARSWADVELQSDDLTQLHKGIAHFANLLAVGYQAEHSIVSSRPYLFLEPQTDEERAELGDGTGVALPKLPRAGARVMPRNLNLQSLASLLVDRPQGAALLGAALGASHGVAKLHELVRLFENAFAAAGAQLAKLLTAFLQSNPVALGYTNAEVRNWVKDLRDPAIHADLKQASRVVTDPDVESVLSRMEQAAYDVLLNKKNWHQRDSERSERLSLASSIDQTGMAHITDFATLRAWDDWDHFSAFRLQESGKISSVPNSWIPIDWYRAAEDEVTIARANN